MRHIWYTNEWKKRTSFRVAITRRLKQNLKKVCWMHICVENHVTLFWWRGKTSKREGKRLRRHRNSVLKLILQSSTKWHKNWIRTGNWMNVCSIPWCFFLSKNKYPFSKLEIVEKSHSPESKSRSKFYVFRYCLPFVSSHLSLLWYFSKYLEPE